MRGRLVALQTLQTLQARRAETRVSIVTCLEANIAAKHLSPPGHVMLTMVWGLFLPENPSPTSQVPMGPYEGPLKQVWLRGGACPGQVQLFPEWGREGLKRRSTLGSGVAWRLEAVSLFPGQMWLVFMGLSQNAIK
ncbi:uncharacterized protein BO97DRAFT_70819 [Aspergillus homomorphus CBS 101889]|uniref:Uncharacterized protein n=1 Tax=Aspergillus homomorphus (strain CBS 101889) TaxID=1450537 RepID=A0A395HX53_ASPHC|nr:hypothetical protein BO97DRAFT_70819 [Aspergillus homomorphus CBS 101889]RAL12106.1 hypothetical protein BO97DRAFT_70819 [Aspergillus homomorphus CBS 101889]